MQLGRTGNRHDPRLLHQQPRERDLRRRRVLPLGESREEIDERLIHLPIFGLEARNRVAEIRAVELRLFRDRTGEKAFPQRAEWDEANPEFFESWYDCFFRSAEP